MNFFCPNRGRILGCDAMVLNVVGLLGTKAGACSPALGAVLAFTALGLATCRLSVAHTAYTLPL